MKDKIIQNKEQLAFNTQVNLDMFMEAKTRADSKYMESTSLETSEIVENLLNNQLNEKNPVELMLSAEMIANGIRQVAATEILQGIKDEAEVKLDDKEARNVIKQVMSGSIRDSLQTENLFIQIKKEEQE